MRRERELEGWSWIGLFWLMRTKEKRREMNAAQPGNNDEAQRTGGEEVRGGAGKNMSHIGAPPMKSGEQGDETAGANRVLWVGIVMASVIAVCYVGLMVRVVQLQTNPNEKIVKKLNKQYSKAKLIERRGTITDRKGRPLAVTTVAKRLFIDPQLIKDRGVFSDVIYHELGYDPMWIEKMMNKNPKSRYIVIDKRVSEKRIAVIKKLKLAGLALEDTLVRDYPQGRTAGQLVGFVGAEGVGLAGLELTYDKRLNGIKGDFKYLRDARGKALWVEDASYNPQQDGENIRLSIDIVIQEMVEDVLKRTVNYYKADVGMMVVMDVRTGEILAMANTPGFDPRDFRNQKQEMQKNKCVTDVFEPGSIFKPIVWSGLSQLGAVKPGETFNTENGRWRTPYRRVIKDSHGYSKLTWEGVLIKSSNIGMSKASSRVGNKDVYEIVKAYGFGAKTGSGLIGEENGIVWPVKKWTKYSKHSMSFGQEISVTALQMVRAIGAIANDGVMLRPTIEAIDGVDWDQRIVKQRVLSSNIAQYTKETMRKQVVEGGGRNANSKLYEVCGKTGTAELPNTKSGRLMKNRYFSSFIGFAPMEDPRLVVGCFVRDPDKKIGHYGGYVSAPAVREILEKSLMYLGVPPKKEGEAVKADDLFQKH